MTGKELGVLLAASLLSNNLITAGLRQELNEK